VRLLILPNLEAYLKLLEPELLLERQKNEMKRHEAWRVYGALLRAAGQCIYDRLKMFPPLPSPPAHTVLKSRVRVVTAAPNKRKASMEPLEHEPALKRIATDGPIGVASANSSPSPMQVETVALHTSGNVDADEPSSSERIANGERSGNRVGKDGQILKMSAILKQVWKDELNSGHTLVSLFELFGDGIMSFIPAPELSMFL
ncbi:putative transcription initiation factor tfiid, partial [Corchorus capsularis]